MCPIAGNFDSPRGFPESANALLRTSRSATHEADHRHCRLRASRKGTHFSLCALGEATDCAYHCPPRAVAIPRALGASAISLKVRAPAFCASRMIGSTLGVAGWRALRMLAVERDTTINALAIEAFNDLLKYGKRQLVENPLLD
jgi:hypothetical protein